MDTDLNRTGRPDSRAPLIGGRLRELGGKRGDHTAVIDDRGSWTYAELLQRSGQFSRAVLDQDPSPGFRAALLFPQERDVIAAQMGVICAAGCFVPIDTGDPPSRQEAIIRDCRPHVLLCSNEQEEKARKLAQVSGTRVVSAASLSREMQGDFPERPPGGLATIFYTSGSTGEPKGVCQQEANLLHFAGEFARALEMTETDTMSLLYSPAFSAANMDIYSSLLCGATLALYDTKRKGVADLPAWLASRRVTVLHTVPPLFRQLLRLEDARNRLATIRAVDLASETLYASDVDLMREVVGSSCRVINHYAATEASVIARHRIDFSHTYDDGPVPIGTPARGLTVEILDENRQPSSPGDLGEIVVTSSYLSPGYWNREEATRKSFAVTDEASGKRCYFTSDRGYRDANGDLHYVGRVDSMVKLRGYSVDPGAVETALMGTGAVQAAAVTVVERTGQHGEKELHAHVVPCEKEDLTEQRLRGMLSERLPDYMIPARMTFRQSLPVTTSGKTDRRRLAAEAVEDDIGTDVHDRQGSDVEQAMAGLFAKILGRRDAGLNDSFYDLGGDSLRMHELMTEAARMYDVQIPFEKLGSDTSPASLASWIRQYRETQARGESGSGHDPLIVTLKSTVDAPNLFLLHGRRAHAFVSPHFVEVLGQRMSVQAIRARGLRPGEEPHLSIGDMAEEYASEIQALQPEGPYFLASICAGALIAVEVASRLAAGGETVAPLIAIDPPSLKADAAIVRRKSVSPDPFREALRNADFRKLESYHAVAGRGSIRYGVKDPYAAVTKHAFAFALYNHQPEAYDGEVLVIANRWRLREMSKAREYRIPGRLRYFNVAEHHGRVFDPGNRQTLETLQGCLDYALCSGTGVRLEAPGAASPEEALGDSFLWLDELRWNLDRIIDRRPVLKAVSYSASALLRRIIPRRRQTGTG
jgi:amino acid adenylation domain-containing protein